MKRVLLIVGAHEHSSTAVALSPKDLFQDPSVDAGNAGL